MREMAEVPHEVHHMSNREASLDPGARVMQDACPYLADREETRQPLLGVRDDYYRYLVSVMSTRNFARCISLITICSSLRNIGTNDYREYLEQ